MLEHPTVISLRALPYRSTFCYENERSSCNVTFESDSRELLEELEYQCLCTLSLEVKEDENKPFYFHVSSIAIIGMIEDLWNKIVSELATMPP